MPVLTFFHEIQKWIKSTSERRDPESPNYIPYSAGHTFTIPNYILGWNWRQDTEKQIWRTAQGVRTLTHSITITLTITLTLTFTLSL